MNWNYTQPAAIIFGSGRIRDMKNLIQVHKKPLLICDPLFIKSGLADEVISIIRKEHPVDIFGDFFSNPEVGQVNQCAEMIRQKGNDIIIVLGGGSALDLAKAASVCVEDKSVYHGTGKEVPGKKAPVVSGSFYPTVALIDPELTHTMPKYITASTGIDVLCHAVEGYWSKGHQPICAALAVHAMKAVFEYLPTAYNGPDNLAAREKLSEVGII